MENLTEHARTVSMVASEAVEETDTIERRPEIVDLLVAMSENGIGAALQRADPDELVDPTAYLRELAEALRPYQHAPLDDAPDLVERLAHVAVALNRVASEVETAST
jgi:hypothetical protein